ncbi:MAG: hypothetical protein U0791_05960 [Gemmataceae bacterium]
MPLKNPYYAICRPDPQGHYLRRYDESYVLDERYSPGRSQRLHAYSLLERELLRVFDYVEPADKNLPTFSHELYQLLLRACTEVETNATLILKLNGYASPRNNWNILDYFKVESACRLSQYSVRFDVWRGTRSTFKPFSAWATTHTLPWYKAYNDVKHDRSSEFECASLSNVMEAITAVLVILFAQFNTAALSRFRPFGMTTENDGFFSIPNGMFEVQPPCSWAIEEQYEFDSKTLLATREPFKKFAF